MDIDYAGEPGETDDTVSVNGGFDPSDGTIQYGGYDSDSYEGGYDSDSYEGGCDCVKQGGGMVNDIREGWSNGHKRFQALLDVFLIIFILAAIGTIFHKGATDLTRNVVGGCLACLLFLNLIWEYFQRSYKDHKINEHMKFIEKNPDAVHAAAARQQYGVKHTTVKREKLKGPLETAIYNKLTSIDGLMEVDNPDHITEAVRYANFLAKQSRENGITDVNQIHHGYFDPIYLKNNGKFTAPNRYGQPNAQFGFNKDWQSLQQF